MALEIFNVGLDALADWGTADYEWALLTAGSFDADAATVATFLAGSPTEVTGGVTGYTREAVSTKARSVDDSLNQITYSASDPSFGSLTGTPETVTAALLIRVVTDDTDSLPIGFATLTPTSTDAADPFGITITDSIVAYVDAV